MFCQVAVRAHSFRKKEEREHRQSTDCDCVSRNANICKNDEFARGSPINFIRTFNYADVRSPHSAVTFAAARE